MKTISGAVGKHGPVVAVRLSPWPQLQAGDLESVDRLALIDTGASHSFVGRQIVQQLNLEPHGGDQVGHLGGTSEWLQFAVRFTLLDAGQSYDQVVFASPDLSLADCILGRDFLHQRNVLFHYDGAKRTFELHLP